MSQNSNQDPLLAEEHKNPSLNREQVNYALSQIDERHKLRDTDIEVVWPFLKFMCCCLLPKRKRKFKFGLKRALRHKLDLRIPKSDQRIEEDPFLLLGYGMNSYFTIMVQLMWLCAFICLITVPLMLVFSSAGGLTGMNAFALGSLGGSEVQCKQSSFTDSSSSIQIDCPTSTLIDLDAVGQNGLPILSVGLIPSNAAQSNYCTLEGLNEAGLGDCSANYFYYNSFADAVRAECQGKDNCEVGGLSAYVASTYHSNVPAECKNVKTQIMVQVACMVPAHELAQREQKGLSLACCAVFLSLFTINFLDYIKKNQENNYIEWDIKTISAGDYTIEFDILPSFFQKYKEQKHDAFASEALNTRGVKYNTAQEAFKDWIVAEMQERLDKMPDCGMEEEPVQHVKVAKATMAFKNSEIIGLLRARGAAIKAEKWEDQAKIESQINDLKNESLVELTTPVSIFMTFENEEGITRALKYHEAVEADPVNLGFCRTWLGDETIEIQPASEPSDIIWENRQYTPNQRLCKASIVVLIIGILLFGSFIVIFSLSMTSYNMLNKYPYPDCDKLTEGKTDETIQTQAYLEYSLNTALEDAGQTVSYGGYVQCFCNDQQATIDDYDITTEYGITSTSTTDMLPICEDYLGSLFWTFVVTNTVMIVIIVINIILKMITIELVTWIGYDTQSELMTKITNAVFYSLFFNTGILLILTYANFQEVAFGLGLDKVFKGPYMDYTADWYGVVGGTLVSTMLLNSVMPPVYEFQTVFLCWFFQRLDQKWEKDPIERKYATQQTQIYAYLDLYTGPDYIVHYKYSSILNIIYVTMLYGIGLPILFPIAILSLFVFWATERYQMAYCYQLPPSMDDRMTQNAMNLMSYTPILFLLNGFWMLGNRQMFENVVNQIAFTTDPMVTGHDWASIMTVNQSTPMLLIGACLVVITVMRVAFYETLTKWGFTLTSNTIEVDENLPNFFEAVKLKDADWIVKESNYYKEKYGIQFVRESVVKRLDDWKLAKKPISGIAWYNLLANQKYEREFNYFPTDMTDREDFIVDGDDAEGNDCEQSDMVTILVNLAYVKPHVAEKFRFAPGYSESFMQAQKAADQ